MEPPMPPRNALGGRSGYLDWRLGAFSAATVCFSDSSRRFSILRFVSSKPLSALWSAANASVAPSSCSSNRAAASCSDAWMMACCA